MKVTVRGAILCEMFSQKEATPTDVSLATGSSKSVYVGTRKMVNYA
jgi:hypothetical protein